MRSRSLSALAGTAVLVVALVAGLASPAGADQVTDDGFAWLAEQQQDDGGFELAGFDGPFETPEAIVAIAEEAQTTSTWSTSEAAAAVEAYDDGTDGATPLDWADQFAESLEIDVQSPGLIGGQAAKLIALVAVPLGESTTAFNPDGADDPVDLEALLADDQPEVTEDPFGIPLFNSYLYATLADILTEQGGEAIAARVEAIRDAQEANGGWNFAGNPAGVGFDDVDTTGYALMVLAAAGLPAGDATVEAALRYLATRQVDAGGWGYPDFNTGVIEPNVNSTATSIFAIEAAGWDQGDACWRTTNAPGSSSRPYVTPRTFIVSQQLHTEDGDDGRFQSPNDGFGINTFATSQALQGLLSGWLPLAEATLQPLEPLDAFSDVPDCAYYSQGVSWMASEGITTGFEGGTFRPTAGISRQGLAAQLYRFSGEDFSPPTEPTFDDVSVSHPFYEAIEWMNAREITTGYPDETFRPATAVNRQQAAAFLHRLAGEQELPPGAPAFPDVSASSPFADAISWMALHRLTNPFPDGTFRSLGPLNRGQLSTFLYRLASTEPAWDDSVTPPSSVLFDV